MIIQQTRYIIVSQNSPIYFHGDNGELTEWFDSVCLYDNKDLAEAGLSTFDEPEKFMIVPVDIRCHV